MELTEADIQEFKDLYEAEFEEQTNWSEAECMAYELIGLYEVIWETMLNDLARKNRQPHNVPPAI